MFPAASSLSHSLADFDGKKNIFSVNDAGVKKDLFPNVGRGLQLRSHPSCQVSTLRLLIVYMNIKM